MNSETFLQLDRVIHERGRLAIMSLLSAHPELSYTEIRDTLAMTDGNVTAHIRTLHETGYVAITKVVHGRRPLTTYALTSQGRKAFKRYIDVLEQIIKETKSGKP